MVYGVLLALTLSCCGEAPLPAETQLPIPVETQLPNPCASEDISELIAAMDDTAKQFEDTVILAENTSPENLETIIKEMQAIEKELEIIDTPSCALRAKAALENYIFSKTQCYFDIYAVEIVGENSLPERNSDVCSLALDQLEYYKVQREALGD